MAEAPTWPLLQPIRRAAPVQVAAEPWLGCVRRETCSRRPHTGVRKCPPLSGSVRPKVCRAVAGSCPPRWTSTGSSGVVQWDEYLPTSSAPPGPLLTAVGPDKTGQERTWADIW